MNLNGNDEEIAVTVFPGGNGTSAFSLYEDNGNDKSYASEYAVTKLTTTRSGNEQTVVIGKREGSYKEMPCPCIQGESAFVANSPVRHGEWEPGRIHVFGRRLCLAGRFAGIALQSGKSD